MPGMIHSAFVTSTAPSCRELREVRLQASKHRHLPKSEGKQARGSLPQHVAVQCHYLDPVRSECLEHWIDLVRLQHEVAGDSGPGARIGRAVLTHIADWKGNAAAKGPPRQPGNGASAEAVPAWNGYVSFEKIRPSLFHACTFASINRELHGAWA